MSEEHWVTRRGQHILIGGEGGNGMGSGPKKGEFGIDAKRQAKLKKDKKSQLGDIDEREKLAEWRADIAGKAARKAAGLPPEVKQANVLKVKSALASYQSKIKDRDVQDAVLNMSNDHLGTKFMNFNGPDGAAKAAKALSKLRKLPPEKLALLVKDLV